MKALKGILAMPRRDDKNENGMHRASTDAAGPAMTTPDPLPVLPILQDTYCDQVMTDRVIEYLQKNRPDFILELLEVSKKRPNDFSKVLSKVATYLTEASVKGDVNIPSTYLGMLDLIFELSRRFEKAFGWRGATYRRIQETRESRSKYEKIFHGGTRFEIRGKPLADDEVRPSAALISLAILETTSKVGVSQYIADKLLESVYNEQFSLWYDIAEELRRGIALPTANQRFQRILRYGIQSEVPEIKASTAAHRLMLEGHRRLLIMCELPSADLGD